MWRHSWNVRCSDPLPLCLLWQDAQTHTQGTHAHTCNHKHPIRSKPECGGSRRPAHALLPPCSCVRMFPSKWVGRGGERMGLCVCGVGVGMEGVIKLKRLGEDELLRIYESRHWLRKANPVHSAFKGALGGKGRGGRRWSGGESLCLDWYKPAQTVISMFGSLGWQNENVGFVFQIDKNEAKDRIKPLEAGGNNATGDVWNWRLFHSPCE